MQNFVFQNPTKIVFGKGSIEKLSSLLPKDANILVTFGGGSIKENGVYEQVTDALRGNIYTEFWGIESNPTYETLSKAVTLVKEKGINFLLAVGGGSVIDGTKYIAGASLYSGDGWDLVLNNNKCKATLPFASVLTLPATGSEMNNGAVISRSSTKEKFPFFTPTNFPQFSILDPQTTYSLPPYQLACGIADAFIHVIEQYLTRPNISPLMDRWAEGIMLTLIENAPRCLSKEKDYDAMSNLMLCATMALNNFITMGVPTDFATHRIGHELTALLGTTHAATLTAVLPSLMSVMTHEKEAKIAQLGERVFGIKNSDTQMQIFETIVQTDCFFQSLGLPTTMPEIGATEATVEEVVGRFTERGTILGENRTITPEVVREILMQTL